MTTTRKLYLLATLLITLFALSFTITKISHGSGSAKSVLAPAASAPGTSTPRSKPVVTQPVVHASAPVVHTSMDDLDYFKLTNDTSVPNVDDVHIAYQVTNHTEHSADYSISYSIYNKDGLRVTTSVTDCLQVAPGTSASGVDYNDTTVAQLDSGYHAKVTGIDRTTS